VEPARPDERLMKRRLRLLLVEDDEQAAEALRLTLERAGYALELARVATATEMAGALESAEWDIIVSGHELRTFGAALALTVLGRLGVDIPLIVLSGSIGEARAVAVMRAGASDVVVKSDLDRIVPIIERELRESSARALRRRVERALKGSEQRYRRIVNTAREGIWMVDANESTTFVNKYMAEMLGYTEHEMLGRPLRDFGAEPAFGQGGDVRLRRKDGSEVWTIISRTIEKGDGGVYAGALGMVTDVTDRKHAEEEKEGLVRELREAVRARDEFLAVASHELRTPVTSLKLHIQWLIRQARRTVPSEAQAAIFDQIDAANRQVTRLTKLIDNLLDVSRLTNRKLQYEFADVDLAAIVADTVARFAADKERPEIHVSAPAPVIGHWDALRLEQVLSNLLTNAIRYGGGAPIEVRLETGGDRAILSVEDRGIGISAEDLPRIFDRFEQATSARRVGGLGLGLYIVRQIVEAHGGEVGVVTEPGKGSTFTVSLPLQRVAETVSPA
jgi:signal transduction histidine kinase